MGKTSRFTTITRYLQKRHTGYRKQLNERSYSQIAELPTGPRVRFWLLGLYFVFPIYDAIIRACFAGNFAIHIPWQRGARSEPLTLAR